MELKDFIHKSLTDICLGIQQAQIEVEKRIGNYPIAPASMNGKSVIDDSKQLIDFELSVNISEESNLAGEVTGKTKGVIEVIGASISTSGKANGSNKESVSHTIRFSVPFFPQALRKNKK